MQVKNISSRLSFVRQNRVIGYKTSQKLENSAELHFQAFKVAMKIFSPSYCVLNVTLYSEGLTFQGKVAHNADKPKTLAALAQRFNLSLACTLSTCCTHLRPQQLRAEMNP